MRRVALVASLALAGGKATAACIGDFDESGEVGFGDLTGLLVHWAPAPDGEEPWDLDDDGAVGPSDLTQLLLSWGDCPCAPSDLTWLPTFGPVPGTGGIVRALTVFDDGSGSRPALYVAGAFTNVAGISAADQIARWDGSSWSAVGNPGTVYDLVVHDDGSGPALYAAGQFSIRRWNGSVWSTVGGTNSFVWALATYDDGSGSGPALYAGGYFTTAGGVPANHIARWDGSSWSALGSGTVLPVHALTVHDDRSGRGECLYVGGTFGGADGVLGTHHIARWDGSTWSALATGLNGAVWALTVFDNGEGPMLHAGGEFSWNAARWDGSTWTPDGNGLGSIAYDFATFDDGSGSGPALYAGGQFPDGVKRWTGSNWLTVGGATEFVWALATYDDGSGAGPALYAGGDFESAGTTPVHSIARFDGSSWSALGNGLSINVGAFTTYDDGNGPDLYAGGSSSFNADRIVRLDGSSWSPLDPPAISTGAVNALTVHDDGSGYGESLYVGGSFQNAGGVASADRIARWNGSSWSGLGSGITVPAGASVSAIVVHDDGVGSGSALYVGGSFWNAGGVDEADHIARWDGSYWSALGSGVAPQLTTVLALAVHDDGNGSGPALYAGGSFTTAGDVPANRIARWDGLTWSPLGSGLSSSVRALAVFDDGSGPALYAGGGSVSAPAVGYVARWNGTEWSVLGSGFNGAVVELTVHDDGTGSGAALYAAGSFTLAGGVPANRMARWNGVSWSALGSGMNGPVSNLAVHDDGSGFGPVLFAGGSFTTAFDTGDSKIARWGCAPSR